MQAPKILPWVARKAGITEGEALDAWQHALAEAVPGLHASIQMLPDGVEPITVDLNEPLEGAPESLHAH